MYEDLKERREKIRQEREAKAEQHRQERQKRTEARFTHLKGNSKEVYDPIVSVSYGSQPTQPQPTQREQELIDCPMCFKKQVEKTPNGYECLNCKSRWDENKQLITQQTRRRVPPPEPIRQEIARQVQAQVHEEIRPQFPVKKKKQSYNDLFRGFLF